MILTHVNINILPLSLLGEKHFFCLAFSKKINLLYHISFSSFSLSHSLSAFSLFPFLFPSSLFFLSFRNLHFISFQLFIFYFLLNLPQSLTLINFLTFMSFYFFICLHWSLFFSFFLFGPFSLALFFYTFVVVYSYELSFSCFFLYFPFN